ncbi:MAG: hypothetical protein IT336_07165 [Thermomicrobiales bacterium]|nr:hypothetical protein [Thermomicrobiales bacterium]
MGHALLDLAGHNAWATERILNVCRELDDSTLATTVPGTYGTVIDTLRHLVDAEAGYLFRLSAAWPAYPWTREPVDLDVLAERAAMLAATWERYLAGEVDTELLSEARGDRGDIFAVRHGVFLAQAFHHANEHRAQILTILSARGHDAPDLSAWSYAVAAGRSWVTSPPDGA